MLQRRELRGRGLRVKDLVQSFRAQLKSQYHHYLETLTVDFSSADDGIQFRAGFALRTDRVRRDLTYKLRTSATTSEAEGTAIVASVFEEIEAAIDDAIADNQAASN
jgi:hypothetical protein